MCVPRLGNAPIKRLSVAGLMAWIVVGSVSTGLYAQDSTGIQVEAAPSSGCLRIRRAPRADAQSVTCITAGTTLLAKQAVPFWQKVTLADGRSGWAAKRYLASVPRSGVLIPLDTTSPHTDLRLEVHFIDVGTGDGIWIHTPDDGIPGNGRFEGKNIVIDGGPHGLATSNPLRTYLTAHGLHEGAIIDALILTHPHTDHFPGARDLMKHVVVRDVYTSDYVKQKDAAQWNAFLAEIRRAGTGSGHTRLHFGKAHFGRADWGDELTVEWIYAYPGSAEGLGTGNTLDNDASVVFKLTYGHRSFLFMGDAEGKERQDPDTITKFAEAHILRDATPGTLRADVLKVGHHGSETSTTRALLAAVDPSVIVISSGRHKYGSVFLPDPSTLKRVCRFKPSLIFTRTDERDAIQHRTGANDADGDNVVISTNGTDLSVVPYADGTIIQPHTCAEIR